VKRRREERKERRKRECVGGRMEKVYLLGSGEKKEGVKEGMAGERVGGR